MQVLRKTNNKGLEGLVEMAILKRKLFFSFIGLLIIAILVEITGWGLIILKFILNQYNNVSQIYAFIVILIGGYYFYTHKNKQETVLLGTTILECATTIATFYTGMSYFHILSLNIDGFVVLFSEKYIPFIMSNGILLYWSLNQTFSKYRKTFYDNDIVTEISHSTTTD